MFVSLGGKGTRFSGVADIPVGVQCDAIYESGMETHGMQAVQGYAEIGINPDGEKYKAARLVAETTRAGLSAIWPRPSSRSVGNMMLKGSAPDGRKKA